MEFTASRWRAGVADHVIDTDGLPAEVRRKPPGVVQQQQVGGRIASDPCARHRITPGSARNGDPNVVDSYEAPADTAAETAAAGNALLAISSFALLTNASTEI